MTDISNKGLALILLVAMVISVGGTIFTLSKLDSYGGSIGYVTVNETGKTNFSITSSLSIRFTDLTVMQFGAGYVNDTIPSGNCVINSTMDAAAIGAAASGCIGFNTTISSRNLTIENDGNILANVSFNFTKNATNFIGGTTPSFQFLIKNNETGSCGTIMNGSTWTEVNINGANGSSGVRVCNMFNTSDTNDTFYAALAVTIPKTASTGGHTVDIYAVACDDGSC